MRGQSTAYLRYDFAFDPTFVMVKFDAKPERQMDVLGQVNINGAMHSGRYRAVCPPVRIQWDDPMIDPQFFSSEVLSNVCHLDSVATQRCLLRRDAQMISFPTGGAFRGVGAGRSGVMPQSVNYALLTGMTLCHDLANPCLILCCSRIFEPLVLRT